MVVVGGPGLGALNILNMPFKLNALGELEITQDQRASSPRGPPAADGPPALYLVGADVHEGAPGRLRFRHFNFSF